MFQKNMDVGNKEIDLWFKLFKYIWDLKKKLLSRQNILNSKQNAAGIEEKIANQGEVLLIEISRIYLF